MRKLDKICEVEWCDNWQECRGYCHTHYLQVLNGKDPNIKYAHGKKPDDPVERFWSKVDLNGPLPAACPERGNCWLWTGYCDKDGYGNFGVKDEKKKKYVPVRAHIYSYELEIGDIKEGLQLDHLCFIRNCVRPYHLEQVTCKVNVLRGNTIAAANKAKTHCIRGHPLSGSNLGIQERGRYCKRCAADRVAGRI